MNTSSFNRISAILVATALTMTGTSIASATSAQASTGEASQITMRNDVNGNETYTFVNHTDKFIDVNYRIQVGTVYF